MRWNEISIADMQKQILIEVKVIMVFSKLGSQNSLQICEKAYDIVKNMASIIMREFYVLVKTHFKPLVILKLIKKILKKHF
jgi:hypothetical protein